MAYNPLPAKNVGDTITQPNWTTIKDDFDATGVAIVTTKGDVPAATGNQALARLGVGAAGTTLVPDAGEATGLAWQIQPACRVYNDADSTPASGVWVTLTFNSERWDTDGMHSVASNTDRLTVPAGGAGLYHITGHVTFGTNVWNDNTQALRILLNGGTILAWHNGAGGGYVDTSLEISTVYSLAATDYVRLQIWTQRDLDIIYAANYSPEFAATWLRGAP